MAEELTLARFAHFFGGRSQVCVGNQMRHAYLFHLFPLFYSVQSLLFHYSDVLALFEVYKEPYILANIPPIAAVISDKVSTLSIYVPVKFVLQGKETHDV